MIQYKVFKGVLMFKIKELEEKDLSTLVAMLKELAEYENMLDEFKCDESILKKSLLKEKYAQALILEYDNKPIGYVIYFFNFSSFWGRGGIYLEDLYIRKEFRKRGFAKEVFKYLARICKEKDLKRMEWVCLRDNDLGINFYEKLGAKDMSVKWLTYRLDGENLEALL